MNIIIFFLFDGKSYHRDSYAASAIDLLWK